MDKLLEHLEKSAALLPASQWCPFVEGFVDGGTGPWREDHFRLHGERHDILEVMDRCLNYDQFETGRGIDHSRGHLRGRLRGTYHRNDGWLATVDGLHSERLELTFEVRIDVSDQADVHLFVSQWLPTWAVDFRAAVTRELAKPVSGAPGASWRDVVLGPGEKMPAAFTGNFLDYSGCATLREVQDLVKRPGDDKVLPLGVYAFDYKPELASPPQLLYLSRYRSGALMAYNGTLVVAPQNSGKTELIVRWALAANRGGYNTFLIDVKGNLYERLRKEGLKGRVCFFSTDPDPALKCDKLNFLEGLSTLTAVGRKEIDQLVQAVLPRDGQETGDDLLYWQVRAKWLNAFVNIRKHFDLYYGTISDLGDIYEIAADEHQLYKCLMDIQRAEEHHKQKGTGSRLPEPGIGFWINEIALLIDPAHDKIKVGQREPRYTYQTLTIGIAAALLPFFRYGTLHPRTSGRGDFTLSDLDSPEQTTIILAAREQDMEDSRTVVSLAIKRLQQILFDRRKKAQPERDVLLLLDETRRIRSFKAGEYITFARDAKAGCVLVYQSISQITSEAEVAEILENVGTQIYLRSLTGETARKFIDMLPIRQRPTYSLSSSQGAGGVSHTVQTGHTVVDFFTTDELYRLPAGDYPALVYIKDHGAGKPFLVNMSQDALTAADRHGTARASNSQRAISRK